MLFESFFFVQYPNAGCFFHKAFFLYYAASYFWGKEAVYPKPPGSDLTYIRN